MHIFRAACLFAVCILAPQLCLAEMNQDTYTLVLRNEQAIRCSYISIDKIVGESGGQTLKGALHIMKEINFTLPTKYGCKPYWRNTIVAITTSGDVYELRNAYYNTDYKHGLGCLDGKIEYTPIGQPDSVLSIESRDVAKILVQ